MSEHLWQLLRFCAVGAVCFGLGLGVLAGLHEMAGVNYLLAYVASFVVANLAGYLLNARFTFLSASVNHTGAARYLTINSLLLLANTGGLKLLVDMAHMWYIAAAALLAIIYTPVSFLAQRLITYRLRSRSGTPRI
jgi:putative flippase GtrA